jgi:hypothetical protein
LIKERYDIFAIIAPDATTNILGSFQAVDAKNPVFILDDRSVSLGEVTTPMIINDVYDIIKDLSPGRIHETSRGPLVISMRKETWNKVIDGHGSNQKIDEIALRESEHGELPSS